MSHPTILTIDLNFQNKPGTIGTYLLPHQNGFLLIECGPGSTIPALMDGLHEHGALPNQITDIFLTHIHLDHAGSSGWWASQGTRIHVHPNGAPHLINPEKLIASASRIYGDQMESLWGNILPVPESQLIIFRDNEICEIGGITIKAVDVPGHANHHLAYLVGDACFTGDIGGIRVCNQRYLSLPMPPPELNLKQWRESILRLQDLHPLQIIPTHFGVYSDAEWHLSNILQTLKDVKEWMDKTMPLQLSLAELKERLIQFEIQRSLLAGLDAEAFRVQQIANPSDMFAEGISRYWNKILFKLAGSA
jgi:glyoxylase-like metal-dependent hydrolase (beta-lactamase superfamily II)